MAENNENFDVMAGKDGLWLSTPEIQGSNWVINLLQPDRHNLKLMLEDLWRKMQKESQ